MSSARILVIDDSLPVRTLLEAHLSGAGYTVVQAEDGDDGWALLEREGNSFDVVLLDRRMPRMDGMEVMARLKATPALDGLPVVMQTAADRQEEIVEGIAAGVYYYLTKPLDPELLLQVVAAAVADRARYRRLSDEVDQRTLALGLLEAGRFTFRTPRQGSDLAVVLAAAMPQPRRRVVGLSELMLNAVEHGNLGITYAEKTALLADGGLDGEIARRLANPEWRDREVEVTFERRAREIEVTITDQGAGFDWRRYLTMDPERVFDTHGRGIALARDLSFDSLEYRGRGNQVVATILTEGQTANPEEARELAVTRGRDPVVPAMQAKLRDTRADLEAFKARLADDLDAARRMQQELLPEAGRLTTLGQRFGLRLETHFETSAELGGDLFGVVALDNRRLALWMVDFAGHGISSALNTFRLHTLLEDLRGGMEDPGHFLTRLNTRLAGLLPTGQYATALFTVFDTVEHRLSYAAASAPAPLVVDLASGEVTAGQGAGLPLGILAGGQYDTRQMDFAPGQALLMHSDALTECGRDEGGSLGREGVRQLLAEAARAAGPGLALEGLLDPFLSRLQRPLSDDLTALLTVRPPA
ncbi:SpoIIE family protein phosphatase [Roseospirillum parvum]|uniref:Histidine kinase-like ATPase domain-containing protein n=1 Tax=Roseospirillum parvum TaxID=83401 RepID=A0A1G8B7E1_9PROT|nr:SpoIIE family protein phosphatase [Roseospirillum parvum]SDH29088.1 Histidine kinase-like ATPase domain-containing protein [Roseospirillum parvum]